MKYRAAFLALLVGAISGASAANAAEGPSGQNYTFTFKGTCSDCTGYGTATLQVQNYVLNTALQNSNLVSFTYMSNLTSYSDVPGYDNATGTSGEFVDNLSGSIDSSPGYYTVHVEQDSLDVPSNTFDSHNDLTGTWSVSAFPVSDGGVGTIPITGGATPEDSGTNGLWNGAVVTAAPEPGTWTLMLGGVGAIGFALRRRRTPSILTA